MDRIELLVKRKITAKNYFPSLICTLLMIVFIIFSNLIMPDIIFLKLIIIAGFIYLDLFLYKHSLIEFDYCFFQGELQVDKVFNKSSRKNMALFNIRSAILIAPINSDRLSDFKNLKVIDISSGIEEDDRYVAILSHNNEQIKLIFQSNDKLLDAIYRTVPNKFFRD